MASGSTVDDVLPASRQAVFAVLVNTEISVDMPIECGEGRCVLSVRTVSAKGGGKGQLVVGGQLSIPEGSTEIGPDYEEFLPSCRACVGTSWTEPDGTTRNVGVALRQAGNRSFGL